MPEEYAKFQAFAEANPESQWVQKSATHGGVQAVSPAAESLREEEAAGTASVLQQAIRPFLIDRYAADRSRHSERRDLAAAAAHWAPVANQKAGRVTTSSAHVRPAQGTLTAVAGCTAHGHAHLAVPDFYSGAAPSEMSGTPRNVVA